MKLEASSSITRSWLRETAVRTERTVLLHHATAHACQQCGNQAAACAPCCPVYM
jgi:hypothetical protein